MATSTISNPNQYESAFLDSTAYTAQVTYYKKVLTKYNGNRVHIELACHFNIDIPTGMSIATVPSEYRPNTNVFIPVIMITDAGVTVCDTVTINASGGAITQGNTGHMRSCYVDGWYNI